MSFKIIVCKTWTYFKIIQFAKHERTSKYYFCRFVLKYKHLREFLNVPTFSRSSDETQPDDDWPPHQAHHCPNRSYIPRAEQHHCFKNIFSLPEKKRKKTTQNHIEFLNPKRHSIFFRFHNKTSNFQKTQTFKNRKWNEKKKSVVGRRRKVELFGCFFSRVEFLFLRTVTFGGRMPTAG